MPLHGLTSYPETKNDNRSHIIQVGVGVVVGVVVGVEVEVEVVVGVEVGLTQHNRPQNGQN